MSKPTVGTVKAKLQLVIGDNEPLLLTTVSLPLHVLNGSDYETYTLACDLTDVTETVRTIFSEAGREPDVRP